MSHNSSSAGSPVVFYTTGLPAEELYDIKLHSLIDCIFIYYCSQFLCFLDTNKVSIQVQKWREAVCPHLFENCVGCSVLFYAALTEFAFSVVESGMTGRVPSLGDMYCYMSVNRCEDASLQTSILHQTKMQHCWTVESACQICVQIAFLVSPLV